MGRDRSLQYKKMKLGALREPVSLPWLYTAPSNFTTGLVGIFSLSQTGKILFQESALALLSFGVFIFKHLNNPGQFERHYMYLKTMAYFSVWQKQMGKGLPSYTLKCDDWIFLVDIKQLK